MRPKRLGSGRGLGCRVQGLGFKGLYEDSVQGLGFRDQGLGFRGASPRIEIFFGNMERGCDGMEDWFSRVNLLSFFANFYSFNVFHIWEDIYIFSQNFLGHGDLGT